MKLYKLVYECTDEATFSIDKTELFLAENDDVALLKMEELLTKAFIEKENIYDRIQEFGEINFIEGYKLFLQKETKVKEQLFSVALKEFLENKDYGVEEKELVEIANKYGISQIKMSFGGSNYHGEGNTTDYYIISFIDENGKLQTTNYSCLG